MHKVPRCASCTHDQDQHTPLAGCLSPTQAKGGGTDYCTCPEFRLATRPTPALGYRDTDGTPSSGFSGTDTSQERARTQDTDGTTAKVQVDVLNAVLARGFAGLTIKDLRAHRPQHHHGTLSGALSNLHKTGRLARLTERRDRCAVYVLPEHVGQRSVERHGNPVKPKVTLTHEEREALEVLNLNAMGGPALYRAATARTVLNLLNRLGVRG